MGKLRRGVLLSAGLALALLATGCLGPKRADDFRPMKVAFEWRGSGCQLSSPSPRIVVADVPEGTAYLKVTLTDRDAPDFRHGGGVVPYTGGGVIEAGALKDYKGPCPPSGSHAYVLRVQALDKARALILGEGGVERRYP